MCVIIKLTLEIINKTLFVNVNSLNVEMNMNKNDKFLKKNNKLSIISKEPTSKNLLVEI